MKRRYTHYFNNKSNNKILEAYGILPPEQSQEMKVRVKPCPQCNEPNKPDSKFCTKCRITLSFDGYQEMMKKEKERDNELKELRYTIEKMDLERKRDSERMHRDLDVIIKSMDNVPEDFKDNEVLDQLKGYVTEKKAIEGYIERNNNKTMTEFLNGIGGYDEYLKKYAK